MPSQPLTNRLKTGIIRAQLTKISGDFQVANSAQSKKRARQNDKHRAHNASQRSMMRTYLKRVDAAIVAKDKAVATEAFQKTTSVLDSMVTKGLIHKNKAARHKHRLNSKIKAL
jgi:small subunit ribosomal protein S20